jgi:hypothetical protein
VGSQRTEDAATTERTADTDQDRRRALLKRGKIMDSKTITWVVIALVAFVLFKDKILGTGDPVWGSGYGGGGYGGYAGGGSGYGGGGYGAPTYATTPPPTPTNQWDTANSLITAGAGLFGKYLGGGGGGA